MLDVRRMRVLREVARQGSFSAAAEVLAYTQSAVSQQIAALEREAGTTLVERSSRGIRLTDAGRALVTHADAILARLADAEAELEAIAGLRGGSLRLASFPTAGATIMPLAIAEFRRRHPGVDISLTQAEPPEARAALKSGEHDIALLIDELRPPSDGIERLHLLDDPMYVVLPRDHPLAGRRGLRLGDLADEAWMFGCSGSCPDSRLLMRACGQAGFEPRVAFESDDYAAIQGFVAAGVGVALIPDLALTTIRDDIVVRSLGRGAPARRIVAGTLEGGYRPPAAGAMLEILQEVSASYQQGRRALALAS